MVTRFERVRRGSVLGVSWVAMAVALLALVALARSQTFDSGAEAAGETGPAQFPPTSEVFCPYYANTTIDIDYCAEAEPDELINTELWAKEEMGLWAVELTDHYGAGTHFVCDTFSVDTAGRPEGLFAFETVAHDTDQSETRMGGEGDCGVVYDATAPFGGASAPAYSKLAPIAVNWMAWENPAPSGGTTSGLLLVQLWTNYEGSGWANTGQQITATGTMTGTFYYLPGADGEYCFDPVAHDRATNQEALGEGADCTIQDTQAPSVLVTTPAVSTQPSWQVSWTGTDPSPGSGVNLYDVEYKVGVEPGPYTPWLTGVSVTATVFGPTSPLTVVDGQSYAFHARAIDLAGNQGSWGPQSATQFTEAAGLVYLPLALKDYVVSPYEENDDAASAFGPLQIGQIYQAYPDDANDWYFFQVYGTSDVTVEVWDFYPTSQHGDLLIYSDPGQAPIGQFGLPGYSTMTVELQGLSPGTYYIRVYTANAAYYSTSDLYSLRWQ